LDNTRPRNIEILPNPIKYNTSTESNALKSGNFWIGTGDVSKGPTSTTGYWNGLQPPLGGYAIYVHKASGGPSISIANNDGELIFVTNEIAGASYTTINQCFTYYNGQSDKMVMHRPLRFRITNGLILDADATSIASYPQSGTTWNDLSGQGNNLTIYGTTPYDGSSFGVGLNSDTGSYVQANPFPFPTDDYTLILTQKVNFNQSNAVFSYEKSGNGNTSLLYAPGGGMNFYGPAGAVGMGYTLPSNEWYQLVRVRTKSSGQEKMYVNGELVSTQTLAANTATPSGGSLNIGQEQDSQGGSFSSSQTMNGYVSECKLYDRTLSAEEIRQSYFGGNIVSQDLVFGMDPGNLVSFEDGTTTTNSLVGSITGSNINGLSWSPSFGGVFDFDGSDDRIQLGYQPTMLTNDITMEAWVNGDSFVNWHGIISNMNGWGTGFSLQIGVTQRIAAMISGSYLTTSWTPSTGVWYHIAATHRSSDNLNVLYVNGVQENTSTRSISYNDNQVTEIGCFYTGGSLPFNGQMGPLRMYDRALSASEIMQNYNAEAPRFF